MLSLVMVRRTELLVLSTIRVKSSRSWFQVGSSFGVDDSSRHESLGLRNREYLHDAGFKIKHLQVQVSDPKLDDRVQLLRHTQERWQNLSHSHNYWSNTHIVPSHWRKCSYLRTERPVISWPCKLVFQNQWFPDSSHKKKGVGTWCKRGSALRWGYDNDLLQMAGALISSIPQLPFI